jgi:hypothetical protein
VNWRYIRLIDDLVSCNFMLYGFGSWDLGYCDDSDRCFNWLIVSMIINITQTTEIDWSFINIYIIIIDFNRGWTNCIISDHYSWDYNWRPWDWLNSNYCWSCLDCNNSSLTLNKNYRFLTFYINWGIFMWRISTSAWVCNSAFPIWTMNPITLWDYNNFTLCFLLFFLWIIT